MNEIINNQNRELEIMINSINPKDLDTRGIDFSDIEYIKSDNFLTRGSVFKNSSFKDTRNYNESNKK